LPPETPRQSRISTSGVGVATGVDAGGDVSVGSSVAVELGVAVGTVGGVAEEMGVLVYVAVTVGVAVPVGVDVGVGVLLGVAVAVFVAVPVGIGVAVGRMQGFDLAVAVTDDPLSFQVTLVAKATGKLDSPGTAESEPKRSASLGPLLGNLVPCPQFIPLELHPVAPLNLFELPIGRVLSPPSKPKYAT